MARPIQILSSDGATTIIDGTSDVFKIAASGTQIASAVGANGVASATTQVTLPGLGTFTNTPAHLSFVASLGASTTPGLSNFMSVGYDWFAGSSAPVFAPSAESGTGVEPGVNISLPAGSSTWVDAGLVTTALYFWAVSLPSFIDGVIYAAYQKFFILQEVAL